MAKEHGNHMREDPAYLKAMSLKGFVFPLKSGLIYLPLRKKICCLYKILKDNHRLRKGNKTYFGPRSLKYIFGKEAFLQ